MRNPQIIHEVLLIVEQDPKEQEQHCNAIKVQKCRKSNLELEIEEILEEQLADRLIKTITENLTKNGSNTKKFKNYMICPQTKLLLFIAKPNRINKETMHKIIIPHKLKGKCLKINHLTHLGIDKTY